MVFFTIGDGYQLFGALDTASLKYFYDANIKNFIQNNTACVVGLNFFIVLLFLTLFILLIIHTIFDAQLINLAKRLKQKNHLVCIIYIKLIRFTKCLRQLFTLLLCILPFVILVSSPKFLVPAIGLFTDNRSPFDPLSTIGAVYTILSAIMLFSLIKTMRKNSIVPN